MSDFHCLTLELNLAAGTQQWEKMVKIVTLPVAILKSKGSLDSNSTSIALRLKLQPSPPAYSPPELLLAKISQPMVPFPFQGTNLPFEFAKVHCCLPDLKLVK